MVDSNTLPYKIDSQTAQHITFTICMNEEYIRRVCGFRSLVQKKTTLAHDDYNDDEDDKLILLIINMYVCKLTWNIQQKFSTKYRYKIYKNVSFPTQKKISSSTHNINLNSVSVHFILANSSQSLFYLWYFYIARFLYLYVYTSLHIRRAIDA